MPLLASSRRIQMLYCYLLNSNRLSLPVVPVLPVHLKKGAGEIVASHDTPIGAGDLPALANV